MKKPLEDLNGEVVRMNRDAYQVLVMLSLLLPITVTGRPPS